MDHLEGIVMPPAVPLVDLPELSPVLTERASFGDRVEGFFRGLFRQASDPAALTGMAGAQVVFGTSQALLLSRLAARFAPSSAKLLATAGAFALEAPSCALITKTARSILGTSQDWGNLKEEIAASYLSLGALKLGGGVASRIQRSLSPSLAAPRLIQQVGMLGGIALGHEAEVGFGLREKRDPAATLFDSLGMLLQFNLSARLLRAALPSLSAQTQEWRARAEIPRLPAPSSQILRHPLLQPLWMFTGAGGMGGGSVKKKVAPALPAESREMQILAPLRKRDAQEAEILESYSIYADYLQSRGNPYGEMLRLELMHRGQLFLLATVRKNFNDFLSVEFGVKGLDLELGKLRLRQGRRNFPFITEKSFQNFLPNGIAPTITDLTLTDFRFRCYPLDRAYIQHFPHLRSLRLINGPSNLNNLRSLLHSKHLPHLELLEFDQILLNEQARLETLIQSPIVGQVKHLRLNMADIGEEGAIRFANARTFPNLRSLDLSYNNLGDRGISAIANSKRFPNLQSLTLDGNKFKAEASRALAQGDFPELVKLSCSGCDLTNETILPLWASRNFPRLGYLNFGKNRLIHAGELAMENLFPPVTLKYAIMGYYPTPVPSFDFRAQTLKSFRASAFHNLDDPQTFTIEFIRRGQTTPLGLPFNVLPE